MLAAGTATTIAFPTVLRSAVLGRDKKQLAPSQSIRLGFVGVRNQGTNNLKTFLKRPDIRVAAICDVDRSVLDTAKALVADANEPDCESLQDYRRLLGRDDIDGVVVTTPDHWHALITVDACNAGKDVYCEKPLSLSVAEGRVMVDVARKNDRIVQTGSQQRSDERFRRACEIVRSGLLGRLTQIRVGLPDVNFEGPPVPNTGVPVQLDFDSWLGPAAVRPYNPKQVHYNFRFFWPYSGGQMTNWGAHHLDIVQWALGKDDSGPSSIRGSAEYHQQNWYEVPFQSKVVYAYDGGPEVICVQGAGERNGIEFEGQAGTLFVSRKTLSASPPDILERPCPVELEKSDDHHGNWLDCIRSRKQPLCDVEVGHRSATVCHLGNIAMRTGQQLEWDASSERIANNPEASAMLSVAYRSPWRLNS
jgi:predicted dehydrogenase